MPQKQQICVELFVGWLVGGVVLEHGGGAADGDVEEQQQWVGTPEEHMTAGVLGPTCCLVCQQPWLLGGHS